MRPIINKLIRTCTKQQLDVREIEAAHRRAANPSQQVQALEEDWFGFLWLDLSMYQSLFYNVGEHVQKKSYFAAKIVILMLIMIGKER